MLFCISYHNFSAKMRIDYYKLETAILQNHYYKDSSQTKSQLHNSGDFYL